VRQIVNMGFDGEPDRQVCHARETLGAAHPRLAVEEAHQPGKAAERAGRFDELSLPGHRVAQKGEAGTAEIGGPQQAW
jgi:hypothetical protein